MNEMNESTVINAIKRHLLSRGLQPVKKLNLFDHADDIRERTFITDLATHPIATKGLRTPEQISGDSCRFSESAELLDRFAREIEDICIFPANLDYQQGWNRVANPTPMVGIAFEIENARSKYFLGSLLAAAVAGRWGILVVPDTTQTNSWVHTVRRMVHKGYTSPIPSNILIVKWPELDRHIRRNGDRRTVAGRN